MKKVVLSLAVLFSVAMVACDNKKTEGADSDTMNVEVAEEVVADSNETAAIVEEVAEPAKEEAKAEEVKAEEAPKADAAAPAEPAKEEAKAEAAK